MRYSLAITFILFIFLSCADAQESIIDSLKGANISVVTVVARQTQVFKSPKAEAAIDARTGRILIARRGLAANMEQNGAGVIISRDGLIVTNYHVVHQAQQLGVILSDDNSYPVKILHLMPQHDLALLKVDAPHPLTPILLADSDKIALGEEVVNIGHSELLNRTISGGRINRLATNTLTHEVEFIQVNMNMYKGDSGGPILDREGRLLGMVMGKFRNKDKATLAIPSNKIKKLYLDFIK